MGTGESRILQQEALTHWEDHRCCSLSAKAEEQRIDNQLYSAGSPVRE